MTVSTNFDPVVQSAFYRLPFNKPDQQIPKDADTYDPFRPMAQ